MDLPQMHGPHDLNEENINKSIKKDFKGNYGLGFERNGLLEVLYVGRSESDLKDHLLQYVDSDRYPQFQFCYADTDKEAFETECKIYHEYAPPDNIVHPTRPEATSFGCPLCDEFK